METRDWITISSAIIVAVGWFVNSYLNRRHEIAKERMKHRLEALLSFLPVFFAIKENRANDTKFAENLAAARTQFLLYCYNDEIEQYEQIVSAIEAKDNQAYTDAVRKTIILVKNRVRKELGLDKHTADEKAEKA